MDQSPLPQVRSSGKIDRSGSEKIDRRRTETGTIHLRWYQLMKSCSRKSASWTSVIKTDGMRLHDENLFDLRDI